MIRGRVTIVTEASTDIGSGHFFESLAIAEALTARDTTDVEIIVNADAPERLLSLATVPIRAATSYDAPLCRILAADATARGTRVFVIDFRRASEAQVEAFSSTGMPVVCVDEAGRSLPCSVVVHGPDYLALDAPYARLRDRERRYDGPVRSLVAAFGGVDRSGSSLAVVRTLAGWRPDIRKTLVIGPACSGLASVQAFLQQSRDPAWTVQVAPASLSDLLSIADVGLTAGGNTLFELACVGTPAIVIYEDPHEGDAGQAFEARGFGRCLCQAASISADALRTAIGVFDDAAERQRQAEAGRTLVDGRGADRIAALVSSLAEATADKELVAHDCAVKA